MLARASGVTYATICRLERGQHKPNFVTINKLSDALALGDPNEIEWDKPSTFSQPVIYIDHQPSPPPSTPAPVIVSQPVGRPESIPDKLAIGKQKLKEDMDKFYKSLLIPILEPRIEKAIAEAIQDGKWHLLIIFRPDALSLLILCKHTVKLLPCTGKRGLTSTVIPEKIRSSSWGEKR